MGRRAPVTEETAGGNGEDVNEAAVVPEGEDDPKLTLAQAVAATEDEAKKVSKQRFYFIVKDDEHNIGLRYHEDKEGALGEADTLINESYTACQTEDEFLKDTEGKCYLAIGGRLRPPKQAPLASRVKM